MNITDSVLTSIKKLLGIAEEYEHFDADLIMHINSVFSILTQLGVGPSKGFMIEDKSATWKDFILMLSRLVDTFFSRTSWTMLLYAGNHSISVA